MDIFRFGKLTVVENEILKNNKSELENIIKNSKKKYILDDSYPANRTIICNIGSKKFIFQLVINTRIFEVIIPLEFQVFFRDNIFEEFLEYLIYMIKLECPEYSIANEVDFSLNIYVPRNSQASSFKWWEIDGEKIPDKYRWKSEIVTRTVLGRELSNDYKRINMPLEFNTSYHIKCCNFRKETITDNKALYSQNSTPLFSSNLHGKKHSNHRVRSYYSNPSFEEKKTFKRK